MDCSRCSRELAERCDMVANIWATRDVGIHELTKKGATRKTLLVREISMFLSVLKKQIARVASLKARNEKHVDRDPQIHSLNIDRDATNYCSNGHA